MNQEEKEFAAGMPSWASDAPDRAGLWSSDLDFVERIYKQVKNANKRHADWRDEALDHFKFYAGDQWPQDDRAKLEEQQRPVVTFNRVAPFIDAVVGSEMNDRKEVRYFPRTLDDQGVNELYTSAAQWVRDQCDAEDEESEAFKDCLICGMGWTETRLDYDEDPDGQIMIERVPPLEMEWDDEARKMGLSDANWVCRKKWMTKNDVLDTWPHAELIPSHDATLQEMETSEHDASEAWKYERDQTWYDMKENRFLVLHYQYREREFFYRAIDPNTGEVVEITEERFEKIVPIWEQNGIPYAKQSRWRYRQAFILGKQLLEHTNCPVQGRFTFQVITGKRDEENHIWFGMMRSMKDPQEWANKFFSQFMHIINANAKGGLLAEEDAFVDPRRAESLWARPDSIILLSNGGLNKVQERTVNKFPAGVDRMLQFAIAAIPDVTGVNLEMLGMVDREQAGILEQQRKQAALTIMAPLFNSLRHYRKQQGRVLLLFIRDYISDGRLIRIKGEEGQKYVRLVRDPSVMTFDVIVDQSPTSPNLKQEVWAILQNVLPAAMRAGLPIPPALLDFTPLPESLIQNWKSFIKQTSQPDPIKDELKKLEALLKQAEVDEMKSKQILNLAKAQAQAAKPKMEQDRNILKLVDTFVDSLEAK